MIRFFLTITMLYAFSVLSYAQLKNLSIDASFAKKGVAFIKKEGYNYTNTDVFIYPKTQEILVGGYYFDEAVTESGLYFAKYNANGSLDSSFAENGVLSFSQDKYIFNYVLRIRQSADNGFLILLGNEEVHRADTTGILCFTAKGKIVTDFGNGGILSSESKGQIVDFDILADAKILALTNAVDSANGTISCSFTRFTQLGYVDKSYGTDGTTGISKGVQQLVRMDKKGQNYICLGNTFDPVASTIFPIMMNLSPLGSPITTFGTDGTAIGAPCPKDELAFPRSVQFLKDGSFLINGYFDNPDLEVYSNFISKFDANGKAIKTFGDAGYIIFDEVFSPSLYNLSVNILNDNTLLVTKTGLDADEILELEAYAFKADGTPLTSFGNDGEWGFQLDANESTAFASALTADGKLIVVGDMTNPSTEFYEATTMRFKLDFLSAVQVASIITAPTVAPNPIQQNATLSYELTENASVSLSLYDVQGRLVQQLLTSQFRNAGTQNESLLFDSSIPAGQYTLKIDLAEKGVKVLKINKLGN